MKSNLVLITGASSGIGAETARKFARLGNKVILLARSKEKLEKIADEIKAQGGKANAYFLDIGDYKAVIEVTEKIKTDIGVPDIIINNAGGGKWRFIEETDYQEAVDMIAAPYLGAFFITKAFMPEMLARNSGHIVNMTSIAGLIPYSGATGYTAARKAMVGFHEALTADLYTTKIKTSLAYFAKVESPYWERNPESEERLPLAQKMIPVLTTEQAAEAIVQGVRKGKRTISAPFIIKVIIFLNYLTPFITRILMNQTGYKRKKEA